MAFKFSDVEYPEDEIILELGQYEGNQINFLCLKVIEEKTAEVQLDLLFLFAQRVYMILE